MIGSKEGDIYSFAIICAEVVTKSWPWNLNNRKEDATEILYMVKKGGHPYTRPELMTDGEMEVNPSLIHLIRDCWTERPSERPTITMVRSQMNSMDSRNGNLMDYIFNILEKYASTLEEEVSETSERKS
ncbi:hypothetical protein DICVIV_13298 [Dictyocaulus viviparus]|uniref:guanylate cyclase n=1 Tax=Dictyocaulus viviparus TaxID=29172 RepID=A0A0D8XEA2_DICVI|nr:hypothetical protein DICVIV_13298 [Dictyocaulus viviparus]